jgi:hypothetical protein
MYPNHRPANYAYPQHASAPWQAPTHPQPRFQVRILKHTGLLMMWHQQSYTVTGTYGQCEAAIREAQQHNLIVGWWSPLSALVMNWVALLANASARKTLRTNAANAHAYAAYQRPHQPVPYPPAPIANGHPPRPTP